MAIQSEQLKSRIHQGSLCRLLQDDDDHVAVFASEAKKTQAFARIHCSKRQLYNSYSGLDSSVASLWEFGRELLIVQVGEESSVRACL